MLMLMMLMTMMKYFNKMYVYRRMVHTLYLVYVQYAYECTAIFHVIHLSSCSSCSSSCHPSSVNFYLSIQLHWIQSFWSRFSNWNEYILFGALQSSVTWLIHEWTLSQSLAFNDDSDSMQRNRRTKAIPMQSLQLKSDGFSCSYLCWAGLGMHSLERRAI